MEFVASVTAERITHVSLVLARRYAVVTQDNRIFEFKAPYPILVGDFVVTTNPGHEYHVPKDEFLNKHTEAPEVKE